MAHRMSIIFTPPFAVQSSATFLPLADEAEGLAVQAGWIFLERERASESRGSGCLNFKPAALRSYRSHIYL